MFPSLGLPCLFYIVFIEALVSRGVQEALIQPRNLELVLLLIVSEIIFHNYSHKMLRNTLPPLYRMMCFNGHMKTLNSNNIDLYKDFTSTPKE